MLLAVEYGWLDYWGFALGAAGLILAVVGFIMGWKQLKLAGEQLNKVATAAEAAKRASEEAVARVSDRIELTELSDLGEQISRLMDALRQRRHEAAVLHCDDARRRLSMLEYREGSNRQPIQPEITEGALFLTALQKSLDKRKPDVPWAGVSPTTYGKITDLDSSVKAWAALVRKRQNQGTTP